MKPALAALREPPGDLGQSIAQTQNGERSARLETRSSLHTHRRNGWGRLLKNILVPTNFSRGSTHALEYAADLANQCAAQVTLLHVIDVSRHSLLGTAEELMRTLWTEGSAQIGQLACSLSNKVEVQMMLAEGLAWEVIVDKSHGFDLVVLAENHPKENWKPFSHHTSQRVLENSGCPVMLVPAQR